MGSGMLKSGVFGIAGNVVSKVLGLDQPKLELPEVEVPATPTVKAEDTGATVRSGSASAFTQDALQDVIAKKRKTVFDTSQVGVGIKV